MKDSFIFYTGIRFYHIRDYKKEEQLRLYYKTILKTEIMGKLNMKEWISQTIQRKGNDCNSDHDTSGYRIYRENGA